MRKKTLQLAFEYSIGQNPCIDWGSGDCQINRNAGGDLKLALLLSQLWGYFPFPKYLSQEYGYRLGMGRTFLSGEKGGASQWQPSIHFVTKSILFPRGNFSPYTVFEFGVFKVISLGVGFQWRP